MKYIVQWIASVFLAISTSLSSLSGVTPVYNANKNQQPQQISETVYIEPLVQCKIHDNCGGGTRQMKQSECDMSYCCNFSVNCGGPKLTTKALCDSSTCCETAPGKWILYQTSEACNRDQESYNSSNHTALIDCVLSFGTYKVTEAECNDAKSKISSQSNNNYAQPTYVPITPYIYSTPIIYATPTVDVARQEEINRCMDRAKSIYDDAKINCRNVARGYGIGSSSWTEQCLQTAQDDYAYAVYLCKN